MTDNQLLEQRESDNGASASNGEGIGSGVGLETGEFQFTFSQPSAVAQACADAHAASIRKIAAVGKSWTQRAAQNQLEGEGDMATPMTASVDKEAQTAGDEQSSQDEICLLRAQLEASESRVVGLQRLVRASEEELALSKEGRLQSLDGDVNEVARISGEFSPFCFYYVGLFAFGDIYFDIYSFSFDFRWSCSACLAFQKFVRSSSPASLTPVNLFFYRYR
jgi:hypothetical protein